MSMERNGQNSHNQGKQANDTRESERPGRPKRAMPMRGEGDPVSADTYNKSAKHFAEEGRVDEAARAAQAAREADPEGHRRAEEIGRSRAKEFSPEEVAHREGFSAKAESSVNDFTLDIQKMKQNAREKMADGPVTNAYGLDKDRVVEVLNQMLATELVCALRYRSHHHAAKGIHARAIANEFLVHATQEEQHAHSLASRISQLGGVPNLDPRGMSDRAHSDYVPATDIRVMLEENLIAERVAIDSYTHVIRWLGEHDTTTRRVVEDILAVEEEHADELASMLARA